MQQERIFIVTGMKSALAVLSYWKVTFTLMRIVLYKPALLILGENTEQSKAYLYKPFTTKTKKLL